MTPVYVDPRRGSKDLLAPLLTLKVPAEFRWLDFGDVQIVGRGPGDRPVLIGIEYKKLDDLMKCVVDKRFVGHQLGGLIPCYEQVYLLIEGAISAAPNRELVQATFKGRHAWEPVSHGEHRWTYETLMSWLHSIRRTGVRDVMVPDLRATVGWIASLHTNWQKPWDEHKTLLGRLQKPMEPSGQEEDALAAFDATPPMTIAGALARGIGWQKARAIAQRFRSPKSVVNATVTELLTVPGIGKKLATEMVATAEREY